MTTTVKVHAHCANTKECVVEIEENGVVKPTILADGEALESNVYDSKKITVYEREKK